jgi:hypothetical protein
MVSLINEKNRNIDLFYLKNKMIIIDRNNIFSLNLFALKLIENKINLVRYFFHYTRNIEIYLLYL